ncbi:MAG: SufS family cysteine desulfurase [Colwellia sp.]
MITFDPQQFRQQFPLITDYAISSIETKELRKPLVYFDNAATTQKPQKIIDSQQRYYSQLNANVHRSSHQLSSKATFAFEESRNLAQQFINAKSAKEIIWTSGATQSINIITQSLARDTLKRGDEIVLCVSEHHANIVPWQMVAEQTGAKIKVLPINQYGYIDVNEIDHLITNKTKFVACAHISNVLGRINPIKKVIEKAKSVAAITVIDGAQAVAHLSVDVQSLDCDFYVFSAHKMYGPTGIGVLYGKQALLETMSPYQGGGEMIKTVSFTQGTTYNSLPFKFEAGTPNIAAIIAFGESIKFLTPLLNDVSKGYHLYEKYLLDYCYQALDQIEQLKFVVKGQPDIGVIAFTLAGHHNHDVAMTLDSYGIAIRSGHHCAMPLIAFLQINGCLRVSLAAYNNIEEIDYFITCLHKLLKKQDHQSLRQAHDNTAKSSSVSPMNDITAIFSKIKGWDSRHRAIMLLGKQLPRMDKSHRNNNTLIAGCESLAWLQREQRNTDYCFFTADSDAKIIRGLLVIVLAAFNGKTAQQIQYVNINDYFETLGLMHHLSPSRSNGLLAIVDKIKLLATTMIT